MMRAKGRWPVSDTGAGGRVDESRIFLPAVNNNKNTDSERSPIPHHTIWLSYDKYSKY